MQLGPYRLVSRIGVGGMGEVWLAEDTQLLRPVAVKIFPELEAADQEARDRFLREARTVARLNHPYITTIYSVGDGATMYIAMELVEGELLSDAITKGLSVAEACRIVRQTAEGLAAAHARSVIHRDIKPENLIVQPSGVKILDFGIAKQVGSAVSGTLTAGNVILGSPYYMSPEQALGRPLDARTDIFSLGIVFFEALTGQRPFSGATITEMLMQIVSTTAPDPRTIKPNLPASVASIVQRALVNKREDRIQTAEEFVGLLAKNAVFGEPPKAAAPAAPAAESTLEVRRALIAEEDRVTRATLHEVLATTGLICDEVSNGAEAIQLLKDRKYAFAFIDLFLPRIDGWGILDFINRRGLDGTMRVFIVTSGESPRLSIVDQKIVTGVLRKPLDAEHVETVIANAAELKERNVN
ncbi:MAG TPA: protein kinase [Thermoanaerobaculia bacterium]|nr:protein kinase [Thermoanaerobaculia bacterium]